MRLTLPKLFSKVLGQDCQDARGCLCKWKNTFGGTSSPVVASRPLSLSLSLSHSSIRGRKRERRARVEKEHYKHDMGSFEFHSTLNQEESG